MKNKIYIKRNSLFPSKFLLIIISFIWLSNAKAQTFTAREGVSLDYSINGFYEYLPIGYETPGKKFPLLISLHGISDSGNGTTQLKRVLNNGIPDYIHAGSFPSTFTVGDSTFSFIVIAPQTTSSYRSGNMIQNVINYCLQNYKVDPAKIYLTGLSQGGGTTWLYAESVYWAGGNTFKPLAGKYLTAILPICGNMTPDVDGARNMGKAGLPVWALHNYQDNVCGVQTSIDWINLLNDSAHVNPSALLTIFHQPGHNAWDSAYNLNFKPKGLNVFQWMLQYRRVNDSTVTSFLPNADTTISSTFSAIADAFVRDGSDTTVNHGSDTLLMVKKDVSGLNRESYLKFSIPNGGTVTSAKLQLYAYNAGSTANTTQWQLWQVNDNSWTESGINWNNKPAKNTLLATINGDVASGFFTWDITSALQSLQAGTISLAIVSTVSGNSTQVSFGSKEKSAADKKPKLIISYSKQSFTTNADGYVRGGSFANDHYGALPNATVKYDQSATYTRNVYFKFVIPANSRTAASSAKLQLYNINGGATANTTKWVLYAAGNNWTEDSLSWNTQPLSGTAIDSVAGNPASGFYNWDISNYLRTFGSDTVSLVLKSTPTSGTTSQVDFSTKEATTAANRPQIKLDFTNNASGSRIATTIPVVAVAEKAIDKSVLPGIVTVYPNPVSNYCLIQSKKTMSILLLYDAAGKLVKAVHNVNAKQYRLAVPNVAKGIYFLTIKGQELNEKRTLSIE